MVAARFGALTNPCPEANEETVRGKLANRIVASVLVASNLWAAEQEVKPSRTNRLANARSPYLLQHAHNPVDWYPWGEEAFARAREEGKPIFLSIGYSTCHWCHVMERESFEDAEIATVLNEHFVSIKLDREERPDVDAVYMAYVQAATGRGGWPMSVWLTPELKPFLGGTYFPPDRFRMVLERIAASWETERDAIERSGDSILEQLRQIARVKPATEQAPDTALLAKAFDELQRSYDPRMGGFSGAPKFPRPAALNFLLRYHARTQEPAALDMVLHTLRSMARGGIHDHLGGGFHRYATDARWHLPHFEKMLYDQAQLACAYLDAYQATREIEFASVARGILDYVLRELTGPAGQLYSAEDADSPLPDEPGKKVEGAFYVWKQGELEEVLGKDLAAKVAYRFGVRPEGNVEQDPHGEFAGKNVLAAVRSLAETAEQFGQTVDELATQLEEARRKLLAARNKRPRPHLDDKALTAWNGLMLSALARAHQVLDEPVYLRAAERAAGFLRDNLYKEGRLLRRYRAGHAEIDGFADDFAFLVQGLLDLYEASGRWAWLDWARTLQAKQDELFWDDAAGGYFKTTGADPRILLRMKEDYDGAEPAPSSVAALNLLRLAHMTDHPPSRRRAERVFAAFSGRLAELPMSMPQLLVALEFHLNDPHQIILAGEIGSADLRRLERVIHGDFLPDKVVMFAGTDTAKSPLAELIEGVSEMAMLEGEATAYVCRDYQCELPVTDPAKLAALLNQEAAP